MRPDRALPAFPWNRYDVAALLLYLALTLLLTYPLSVAPGSTSIPMGPDGDLFAWTLAWNTHALVHQPWAPFDANIFYPEPRTLAYSENLIGSTLFAAPVLWLTGNPVLALNVVALASCVLCGFGAFYLARRLGLSYGAALICGMVFAFSPARFFRISQLHLTTVQWVPFALAFAHGYLDSGRRADLRWAIFFFSLQCVTSGHGAMFAGLALVCLAAYRVLLGEPIRIWTRVKDVGLVGLMLLVPTWLVFLPYYQVQRDLGFKRPLDSWGVTPVSFFAAPTHVQTWVASCFPDARILERADAYLFPGFLPLILAAVALAVRPRLQGVQTHATHGRAEIWSRLALVLTLMTCVACAIGLAVMATGPVRLKAGDFVLFSARDPWRALGAGAVTLVARLALLSRVPFDLLGPLRWARSVWSRASQRGRRSVVGFYGGLGLLTLLLAIGPPFGIWPLVYWLPGVNFTRVPSRFVILGVLSIGVLAGVGFDRLARARSARARRVLACVVGTLLAIECAGMPLQTVVNEIRVLPAHEWLAGRPGPFAVAEVPLPPGSQAGPYSRRQAAYMLHSMAHWQRTVHGHSGFAAPSNYRLFELLTIFPDETCLRALTDVGVSYVVVHPEFYDPDEWDVVRDAIERAEHWLRLEHVAGTARVYSLQPPLNPDF